MILDRCIRHQDCSHNRMCIKGACIGKCISIEISAEQKFKSIEKQYNYVFIQRTMLLQKSH